MIIHDFRQKMCCLLVHVSPERHFVSETRFLSWPSFLDTPFVTFSALYARMKEKR